MNDRRKDFFMEKETKDCQLKFRVTKSEKDRILAYCEKLGINLSDFLRDAYSRIINKEEEKNGNRS